MNLNQIKGQERAKRELEQFVKTNKIPHALLFCGMPGIGKFSLALAFSAFLNCENHDTGCETCGSCTRIFKGNHPDLLIINPIPERNDISIEQIRELILKMKYAPLEGKYKIVIIDQAEKLNKHSANALLKILEEPPPNSILILVTSNIRNIQPTIISRCSLIKFSPLDREIIIEKLSRVLSNPEEIELLAKISEGSLGKALSLANGRYTEIRSVITKWLKTPNSLETDPIETSEFLTENYSDSLNEVFDMLMLIQRDLIAIKRGLLKDKLFNPDIFSLLADVAKSIPIRRLLENSRLIYLTRNTIFHNNANARMALDNLFLQLSYGSDQN